MNASVKPVVALMKGVAHLEGICTSYIGPLRPSWLQGKQPANTCDVAILCMLIEITLVPFGGKVESKSSICG